MAAAFWTTNRASPFHYKGGVAAPNYLKKELKELLKAFKNKDPPPNRQKVVSPCLLEDLLDLAKKLGVVHERTADLIVEAFFFAMQGCKFCLSKRTKLGRTKLLKLGNLTFWDKNKHLVPKSRPDLEDRAHCLLYTSPSPRD